MNEDQTVDQRTSGRDREVVLLHVEDWIIEARVVEHLEVTPILREVTAVGRGLGAINTFFEREKQKHGMIWVVVVAGLTLFLALL